MIIEKKYLVREVPDLRNTIYTQISEGYLSYDPEISIRKSDTECYIIRKGIGTLKNSETKTKISGITYEILSDLIKGRTIKKVRTFIKADKKVAELDTYLGDLEGLAIVSVKFDSEQDFECFNSPTWFGEEITDDKRYQNSVLSKMEEVRAIIHNANIKRKKLNSVN